MEEHGENRTVDFGGFDGVTEQYIAPAIRQGTPDSGDTGPQRKRIRQFKHLSECGEGKDVEGGRNERLEPRVIGGVIDRSA